MVMYVLDGAFDNVR